MGLLADDQLERSAVVANCRMNRERDLTRLQRLRPGDSASTRSTSSRGGSPRVAPPAWLDLCCGTGKALIQASEDRPRRGAGCRDRRRRSGRDVPPPAPGTTCLRLVEASLTSWQPDRAFDLITCVHGLHYVGDKLGLIARACSWLAEDGLFVASLDLANFKLPDGRAGIADLRRAGLEYDRRRRLIHCRGRKSLDLPFRYLGADDRAGQIHGPARRGLVLLARPDSVIAARLLRGGQDHGG